MPTTACVRDKLVAAEVGVGAVPKCHKAALLPFPSGTKGLLCLQPGRGHSVLPLGTPRSPSLAHGRTLEGLSGRSTTSPPLAHTFAPTLGQELC